MPQITAYYGIPGQVPFLDVDIAVDNRMFVDPHAIRLHGRSSRFAMSANECTETFFREVTQRVFSGDQPGGLELLQRFVEPWETRLGLAKNNFRGRGGADDVGLWIWRALTTDMNALLQVGVLQQVEDLPLFIEGIDRDITSDITTRIIFEPLADFTAENKSFQLPEAGEMPLLLVPSGWARPTLLMSAVRYYETSVLGYAQLERAIVSSTGKLLKTPKDKLMTEPGLGRGRVTNLNVTRRAHAKNDDLVAKFKSFVDMKWTPPEGDSDKLVA
ncbi:hypothetical protein [Rhodococcus sp. NCIMB 12038]|uniref:hypothetical protein n=1 Tax=Rhodococcus sp. NCIMB 12038 TaxID=933800 RepID=UPI000B3C46DD|nr:hypothetical protein [Rhodococcus sp. NCIMB 12038]OUS96148.1 hypothetical protein CA951_09605 [Rhodococcus sp. NCIMB 12038]